MSVSWPPEFEAVVRLAADLSADRPLGPDDELFEMGISSVRYVSLILELEQLFGVEFPDDAMTFTMSTPLGIWTCLDSLLGQARTATGPGLS